MLLPYASLQHEITGRGNISLSKEHGSFFIFLNKDLIKDSLFFCFVKRRISG